MQLPRQRRCSSSAGSADSTTAQLQRCASWQPAGCSGVQSAASCPPTCCASSSPSLQALQGESPVRHRAMQQQWCLHVELFNLAVHPADLQAVQLYPAAVLLYASATPNLFARCPLAVLPLLLLQLDIWRNTARPTRTLIITCDQLACMRGLAHQWSMWPLTGLLLVIVQGGRHRAAAGGLWPGRLHAAAACAAAAALPPVAVCAAESRPQTGAALDALRLAVACWPARSDEA